MTTIAVDTTPTDWSAISDAPYEDTSRFQHDDKLHVKFDRRPRLQAAESSIAGRAIYKEIDFITIIVPGDKASIVERPVQSYDATRFAAKYANWKANAGEVQEGTPISSLPRMTPSKIEEYKFFSIHTVEQLAAASDSVGQKFFGFQDDKRSANAFLEIAKGNAPFARMNDELKERDAKIEEMQSQIEALNKMMTKAKV
jgi:hypothetical protein